MNLLAAAKTTRNAVSLESLRLYPARTWAFDLCQHGGKRGSKGKAAGEASPGNSFLHTVESLWNVRYVARMGIRNPICQTSSKRGSTAAAFAARSVCCHSCHLCGNSISAKRVCCVCLCVPRINSVFWLSVCLLLSRKSQRHPFRMWLGM
jgi:hypothetical protein